MIDHVSSRTPSFIPLSKAPNSGFSIGAAVDGLILIFFFYSRCRQPSGDGVLFSTPSVEDDPPNSQSLGSDNARRGRSTQVRSRAKRPQTDRRRRVRVSSLRVFPASYNELLNSSTLSRRHIRRSFHNVGARRNAFIRRYDDIVNKVFWLRQPDRSVGRHGASTNDTFSRSAAHTAFFVSGHKADVINARLAFVIGRARTREDAA